MKTFKLITAVLLAFVMTSTFAQTKEQTIKTKSTKTFNFKKDGKTIPYRITVYKTATARVLLDEADKEKVNQDMNVSPQEVTKLIYVDNDLYSDYDKFIVLRYTKEANDSFELMPTERGFKVVVDKKNVEYIFGEGVYFVNNADKDYFFVDEFDSI
ncbi:hypothetical protein SAMN04487910_3690 [Aquimarina amphilecti]|uniref:Intein N-terminal splicing region n=1 Tax=Aquimarina amphilecti TaxID=1038014 RepID=A0A1H7UED4_AQUAM|nr:hypothetical protein [Aquimarina amphilecti]SEL95065.1 hypothetical protein SAMN04487910_3690 [Aquimarina amphilecti]